MRRGFTLIEVLIVVVILGILTTIVMSAIVSYTKNQALNKDVEAVIETLRQARGQTLASKNGTTYGVHFASTTITLFAGATYSPSDPGNQSTDLQASDVVLNLNLAGNGSDVIFERLTGETDHYGTVVISSPSETKTVTIYKTGVIQ